MTRQEGGGHPDVWLGVGRVGGHPSTLLGVGSSQHPLLREESAEDRLWGVALQERRM